MAAFSSDIHAVTEPGCKCCKGSLPTLHVQVSALPVVYKLLTAEDKGSQKVAIEMLTFLCEMGSEWQTQEQLNLAKFGNGAILANLVQRIGHLSNQTKLSAAKAAELARLLQLLSSATSGNIGHLHN